MHASYAPISCSFHDGLEDLATTRKQASIAFRTQSGETQIRDAAIVDLFSRDGAEHVVLSTGETIRLDRLLAVDGVALDLAEPPLQE